MQDEGLQRQYNDPQNREIKIAVHQICAIAFVPVAEMEEHFVHLRSHIPDEVEPVYDYFDHTYVRGRPARVTGRGRRPAQPRRLAPRYPPVLWNQ